MSAVWHLCDYCRASLPYVDAKSGGAGPKDDVLVGRSVKGGWVCRACYKKPVEQERNYLDVAREIMIRNARAIA